jgi:hypothetical protein
MACLSRQVMFRPLVLFKPQTRMPAPLPLLIRTNHSPAESRA